MNFEERDSQTIVRSLDFNEEIRLRMERYHQYRDIISLFQKAYKMYQTQFHEAVSQLKKPPPFFLEETLDSIADEQLKNITLSQIEDIANAMNRSGFEFLEMGQNMEEPRFFNYLPMKKQPGLEDLFLNAIKRETETIEFHIAQSEKPQIYFDKSAITQINIQDIPLSNVEKAAQELFTPAFELIKREYILIMTKSDLEYNPHRTFNRLSNLSQTDKLTVMEYVRHIIQGDEVITSAETEFVNRILALLELQEFDTEQYFQNLLNPVSFEELRPLLNIFSKKMLSQVLCMVIDCAYADRILTSPENTRLLKVAEFILETKLDAKSS